MGRPLTNRAGYLPELAEGIRRQHAYLSQGYPGIVSPALDAFEAGEPFTLTAGVVWQALYRVAPALARDFYRQHGGPWPFGDEPTFVYDPAAETLAPANTDEG